MKNEDYFDFIYENVVHRISKKHLQILLRLASEKGAEYQINVKLKDNNIFTGYLVDFHSRNNLDPHDESIPVLFIFSDKTNEFCLKFYEIDSYEIV